MQRAQVNPVSLKRRNENIVRVQRMRERFGPQETWQCGFENHRLTNWGQHGTKPSSCFGPVFGHEILKRSRGGSITDMNNVVLLCQYHNGWVEDNPYASEQMGLARHSWDSDEHDENVIRYGSKGPKV